MDLERSFDALSTVIEQYEASGSSVRTVEASTSAEDDGGLQATVEVPVSLCALGDDGPQLEYSPGAASLTEDGGLALEFAAPPLPEPPSVEGVALSAAERAARVEDGELLVTVDVTIDPSGEAGTDPAATPDPAPGVESTDGEDDVTGTLAAVRDDSVPPYEDTRYLERLFESCDTFAGMADRIEMDVSPETVRRYMIEAGIHDPTSYDTAADAPDSATGDAESRPGPTADEGAPRADEAPAAEERTLTIPDDHLLTDGLGLPADHDLTDVADAVVDSSTVYGVAQDLDLEQGRTRDLLRRLGLLDLVMRRLGDDPERSVSYEQVARRIRQRAPDGAEAGT